MTDKQQIEELRKFISHLCCHSDCGNCKWESVEDGSCLDYFEAQALYNANYRRIGEDEIVVKADKYKRLVSILKNLKALAHDVDDYQDDIITDYRNMAETHMDWIIEELLNLNEEELL